MVGFDLTLTTAGGETMQIHFIEGNEAIARGAVAAGCRFFAGYPITPASTIFNTMMQTLPPTGGVCMQGEDEIASIGFCLGASMAGMKVMTATSGPGISLYSEQISFAIGSEIPIVIVNVQRLGPSTGSATKAADGDIQFMRWGNSGGLPVIVLAPVDVRDCYTLTATAFNLSERYRCPVFIAANKDVSMTRESVAFSELTAPGPENRRTAPPDREYQPFAVSGGRMVPDFLPVGGQRLVRQTSSTHGMDGYITTDPAAIAENRERLKNKILAHRDDLALYSEKRVPGARTLVISYGVTARSALQLADRLEKTPDPVSVLVLKTLWPVSEGLIRKKAAPYDRIVVAELNLGQYVRELERLLPDKQVRFTGRMNGNLLTPEDIKEAIAHE